MSIILERHRPAALARLWKPEFANHMAEKIRSNSRNMDHLRWHWKKSYPSLSDQT